MSRVLAALALPLLLAACQRTVFENAPVEAAAGCDPDLVGTWHSEGDTRAEDGELRAVVGPDCTLVVFERKPAGEKRSPPTTLHTGRTGGVRYLWVDAAWVHAAFDVGATAIDREGDVYLYAWRTSRDVLRLAAPPHRALAHRVIDDDIDGEVMLAGDNLVVRVKGSPEAVRKTLSRHRLFRLDEALRFRKAAP